MIQKGAIKCFAPSSLLILKTFTAKTTAAYAIKPVSVYGGVYGKCCESYNNENTVPEYSNFVS